MPLRILYAAGKLTLLTSGALVMPPQIPVIPVTTEQSSRRKSSFIVDISPLVRLEWWAVLAVRCGLRSARWLAAVEDRIAYDAADAARTTWPNNSERQGKELYEFTKIQAEARVKAEASAVAQCSELLTTAKLNELDRMATAAGW
ncbi:hypothetical protein [Acidiphilium sp. PM]|uniref:hypothetical protein n=1 Tax=Acidiphilium sp. PM TaxID=1043206 RepID=UPI0009FF7A6F|nr:hypothetical protein [Acidiphilium sp. PM]